ncbi:MAG: hypothetical protein SGARI_005369, partial [Bacillariaceae sp.]
MAYAVDHNDDLLPKRREGGDFDRMQDGADRMKHLFCYDQWMAGYILVLLAYFGWLFWGAVIWATMDQNEQCDNLGTAFGIAYGFGWAFVYLGAFGLCCSFCCGVFVGKHRNNDLNQPMIASQYGEQPGAQQKIDEKPLEPTTKVEEVDVEEGPTKKVDPN